MSRSVKILAASILGVVLAAFGQSNSPAQTAQEPSRPGMMGRGGMGQGMAGQGMTGGATMNQMATRHQQMTELMNKLTQSMAALESEKDPAALQSKLAEHRALLEQMRTHMTQQGGMMQRMAAQVQNCPMMGQTAQPPTQ